MHLRHVLIENCKLMRRLEVPFVRDDGSPRLWTVFVGENGTCKTTLLRALAMATTGAAFANNLVGDPAAYMDRRSSHALATVDACLGFSSRFHGARGYPQLDPKPATPPELLTRVEVGATSVQCHASYGTWRDRSHSHASWRSSMAREPEFSATLEAAAARAEQSGDAVEAARLRAAAAQWMATGAVGSARATSATPLDAARSEDLPHWFAAAYGVGRVLSAPQSQTEGSVPKRDRLRSLFDARHLPMGTGSSDLLARLFGDERARHFAECLREALCERMGTPKLKNIDLRGQGGVANQQRLIESHRFEMALGNGALKLPAVWLSQGYQAVISLVADLIGHVWLEAGAEVELVDMEGIVFVDELDLHLHPTWQAEIVIGLKAAFPRMQFIVTTHSPLVLAGCTADEVWMLKQDAETGDVTASQGEVSPMLLTVSELVREFFSVERTYASELGEALRRYVDLASNPFRSDDDDANVRALRTHLLAHRVNVDFEPVARKSLP